MGKDYDELSEEHIDWISTQPMFFVATAPDDPSGHVNLSPKGYDTFRVVTPNRVAYLDLTGSGIETIAHVRQNPRITVMFCAFQGRPRILRLYGHAAILRSSDHEFGELAARFDKFSGTRSIVDISVSLVRSSCGFSIPEMELRQPRHTLIEWADRKGEDGIERYWSDRNAVSIDGLPGL